MLTHDLQRRDMKRDIKTGVFMERIRLKDGSYKVITVVRVVG